MSKISSFEKKGYVIIELNKKYLKTLSKIKNHLEKETVKKLTKKNDFSLENFHKFKLKATSLNNFRMEAIEKINKIKNLKLEIYNSMSDFLNECLGPDIIVQKRINLVIQKPNDNNRAPFHKDAPGNSNYELVVWIPLVDCYRSMNMYIFELSKHKKTQKFLQKNKSIKKFESYSKKEGFLPNIKFGEVLIFWTNNYHYIPINRETKTRWSLNLRYKNLFTKYGTKNLLDFYEILKLSPMTKLLDKIDV